MKQNFLLAAAALAVASAAPAMAGVYDWGEHDPAEAAAAVVAPGAVFDAYTFTIGTLSNLSASAVANNLGSTFTFTDGLVTLYQDIAGPDTVVGSFSFNGTSGDTSYSFANLTSGSYYYLVTGSATGSAGGIYALASSVTAVPEPEAAALLLAGLAVVGGLARRRSANRAA